MTTVALPSRGGGNWVAETRADTHETTFADRLLLEGETEVTSPFGPTQRIAVRSFTRKYVMSWR